MLLLRPLIFGGIFFAFGVAVLYLYRQFLVVLPEERNENGNNVDISIEDDDGDDNDAGMMAGEADAVMDFTGFAEVNAPSQNEVSDGQKGDNSAASGIVRDSRQEKKGLEQNSTIGYTSEAKDAPAAFMPMVFDDLKGDTEEMPQSVVPPSAGDRKVYARVSEKGSLVNADPKKLASTVQNLLSDE
jgi:hypothetical protein